MTPVDIGTEKMLSGKTDSIKELFFTLRQVIVEVDDSIVESIKWGMPHFDYEGIMCGVGAFKNHVSIWFHKGDKMSNNLNLFNAETDTKKLGQIKFFQLADIDTKGIQAYVREAIKINIALKTAPKVKAKLVKKAPKKLMDSKDLNEALMKNPRAEEVFMSMTVSQKNGYIEYIEESKQAATKKKRIARSVERLANGLKAIY